MSPIRQTVRDTLTVLAPPVVVLALHLLRVIFLTGFPAFDMLAHFAGGASILGSTLLFGQVARRRGALPADTPPWLMAVALVGAVAVVGILWEFFEFSTDYVAQTQAQGGLADTISDLALDLLGGVAMLLATPWLMQRLRKN